MYENSEYDSLVVKHFVLFFFSSAIEEQHAAFEQLPPPLQSSTTCNGINKTLKGTYLKHNPYDLQKPQSPVWYNNGTVGTKNKLPF